MGDLTGVIEGVHLTPLSRLDGPDGSVLHGLKASDPLFNGFGEAYFSSVRGGAVKPWRRHFRMRLNLMVPAGSVRFVLFDDRRGSRTHRAFMEVVLSADENYQRLTVAPGIWMAFQGRTEGLNLVMNLADLEHDPSESERRELHELPYPW